MQKTYKNVTWLLMSPKPFREGGQEKKKPETREHRDARNNEKIPAHCYLVPSCDHKWSPQIIFLT